jgi:hypothetical protein
VPIQNFETLLKNALEGKHDGLNLWFEYTRTRRFSKEEITKALDTINTSLSDPSPAKRGHAFFLNGLWCQYGINQEVNYSEAIKFYVEAIRLKNPSAMTQRAFMHQMGHGGQIDTAEAMKLYQNASDLKDPLAMNNLAKLHQKKQNYKDAIKLYDEAITLNDPSAMHNRAYMYEQGLGCKVNSSEAMRLYEKAANLGNTLAAITVGMMYLEGCNGEVDYKKGLMFLKQYQQATGERLPLDEIHQKIISNIKKNKEIKKLYAAVDQMFHYGGYLNSEKGDMVKEHAQNLKNRLDSFIIKIHEKDLSLQEENDFKVKFDRLVQKKDRAMGDHRAAWKPIVLNILIALSGVGFIALAAKLTAHAISSHRNKTLFSLNKAAFFAETHSQKLLKQIENANKKWTLGS